MIKKEGDNIAHFFAVVMTIFALIFMLWMYNFINSRYSCVELPNGLFIGRTTFFSSLLGSDPDISIKFPNGNILRRGDGSINFFDEVMIGGDYYQSEYDFDEFIFVKNLGLIIKSSNPDLFAAYWNKKQKSLISNPSNKVDTLINLFFTSKRKK